MKKIILIIAAIAILFSCKRGEQQRLDPDAMISLRAAQGVKSDQNPEHYTALEIVQHTTDLAFRNPAITGDDRATGRSFEDHQRDFVNERLLMWGTDVIDQYGAYEPGFIEGYDFVLRRIYRNDIGAETGQVDTIAYIPNSVIREAEMLIKAAYAEENWDECYRLFDQAFFFTPISGPEWRELKKQNLN